MFHDGLCSGSCVRKWSAMLASLVKVVELRLHLTELIDSCCSRSCLSLFPFLAEVLEQTSHVRLSGLLSGLPCCSFEYLHKLFSLAKSWKHVGHCTRVLMLCSVRDFSTWSSVGTTSLFGIKSLEVADGVAKPLEDRSFNGS